jgi:anti-anti-sigma factor
VAHFQLDEQLEDGWLLLRLRGELDLASAPVLAERLSRIQNEHARVRLDLSRLEFIDSSGLHVLIQAATEAADDGRALQVDPELAPIVRQMFELVGVDSLLVTG